MLGENEETKTEGGGEDVLGGDAVRKRKGQGEWIGYIKAGKACKGSGSGAAWRGRLKRRHALDASETTRKIFSPRSAGRLARTMPCYLQYRTPHQRHRPPPSDPGATTCPRKAA